MALSETSIASYSAVEWFNDVFSELINFEMINPPYNNWTTDKWQFLKKRDWYQILIQMTAEIIDYFEYWEIFYVLTKSTNLTKPNRCDCYKVKKDWLWNYTLITLVQDDIFYDEDYNRWTTTLSKPWGNLSVIWLTYDWATPSSVFFEQSGPSFTWAYIWAYWFCTNHYEWQVLAIANSPSSHTIWAKYIVWPAPTWEFALETPNYVLTYDWTRRLSVQAQKWLYVYNLALSTYQKFDWAAWVNTTTNPWDKKWIIFKVIDVISWSKVAIQIEWDTWVEFESWDIAIFYPVLKDFITFNITWYTDLWLCQANYKFWIDPITWEKWYFNTLWNYKDMEFFDWRLFTITDTTYFNKFSWQPFYIWASGFKSTSETQLTSLENVWDFLFVWWLDKTYAITRTIDAGWLYLYGMRDLTTQWLFSKKSIVVYAWSLYAIMSDKSRYAITVNFSWQYPQVILKDTGTKIQNFLDRISEWDNIEWYVFAWDFWFVSQWQSWSNNILIRFDEDYGGFLVDELWYWFANYKSIHWISHSMYWNNIYIRWWDKDDDLDIEQKMVIIWPEGLIGFPFRLLMIRLVLWYLGSSIKFDINLEMDWQIYKNTIDWDATQSLLLQTVNLETEWTLWTTIKGTGIFGWLDWSWNMISNMLIMWVRIAKTWHIAKFTITNKDNSNLIFGRMDMLYQSTNPMLVPIKNVI